MKMITASPTHVPPSREVPRLLAGLDQNGTQINIEAHLSQWGPLSFRDVRSDLVDQIHSSGLAGRGGASFPVGAKLRSVQSGVFHRPVVVANGAEGEPASAKDELLLKRVPHLVLDGASAAAVALNASRVVAYVPRRLIASIEAAVNDRRRWALDPVEIEVVEAPDAFLAGQESAVVNALNRHSPVPTFVGINSVRRRGVGGRPTLVQNVETLAHVALVARYGSTWFRQAGIEAAPGTMLLTVHGLGSGPRVIETPLGIRLGDALGLTTDSARHFQGVLLGGYGGAWLPMPAALDLPLSEQAARKWGATLGAGVVVLLPKTNCPLAESAWVVHYLARQSAGQCGPCVNGLAELAELTNNLAWAPSVLARSIQPLLDVCDLVEGRGACRHPDGAARFVRSTLRVFATEVDIHMNHGPCLIANAPTTLPGLGRGNRVDIPRVRNSQGIR